MIVNRPCKVCNKQSLKDGLCVDHIQTIRTSHIKRTYKKRRSKKKYKSDYPLKNCSRWIELRKRYIAQNRHCQRCLKSEPKYYRFADEVDHIKPVRKFPSLAYDVTNLQSLCKSCHSTKSQYERKGYYCDYANEITYVDKN